MILLTSYICLAAVLYQSRQVSANFGALKTSNPDQQKEIVDVHNKMRRSVKPAASNMLKMAWSNNIAANAQRWANQCILDHSEDTARVIDGMQCGENLYFASHTNSWTNAIKMWYDEVKDFVYGHGAKPKSAVIGHYTQVVWYNSFLVGCGIAHCPQQPKYKYYYVCQYCYAGNIESRMATPYKTGTPCADCPNACDNGLCTNPCRYKDEYTNCPQLKGKVGCAHEVTKNNCKATCHCPTEIK